MNGKTRVCGVIGCPVEHSMSPQMHNFYAERTGLNLAYVPFRVEPQAVGDAVKGAYALNLLGLNVTVPHKQRVMEYLVEIDEDARAIGAVNTLVRMEGGYKGYNTDAAGLKRAMDRAGIAIRGQRCLLLGAGGAAKAAAYLLAREGADEVFLLNRNLDRAAQLAGCVNGLTGRDVIRPMALADYGRLPGTGRDFLCIQSTSVGMHPDTDRAVIEDEAFYERIHTGVDIVYTPSETKFMRLVRASGGGAVGGLDMLLYQGIIEMCIRDSLSMGREDTSPPRRSSTVSTDTSKSTTVPSCFNSSRFSSRSGSPPPTEITLVSFSFSSARSISVSRARKASSPREAKMSLMGSPAISSMRWSVSTTASP